MKNSKAIEALLGWEMKILHYIHNTKLEGCRVMRKEKDIEIVKKENLTSNKINVCHKNSLQEFFTGIKP